MSDLALAIDPQQWPRSMSKAEFQTAWDALGTVVHTVARARHRHLQEVYDIRLAAGEIRQSARVGFSCFVADRP